LILFAATGLPLLMFMGGVVDVARFARYRAELANAVDSAALALARQHSDYSDPEATEFVTKYIGGFGVEDSQFTVETYDAKRLEHGWRVTANGTMKTMFLPIAKLRNISANLDVMKADILAEVSDSTNRLELALVFDNTGSMNCGTVETPGCANNFKNPGAGSRIVALKAAAHTLINSLMSADGGNPDIKIGLVPFEGDVNVGQSVVDAAYSGHPPAWLDWSDQATAKYNGQNFGKYDFVAGTPCTSGSNCKFVGHKWIYDKLRANDPNVKWAGCVEMRAEPYDLTDSVPSASVPDTLFVPRIWPDEPDSSNNNGHTYLNNYLNDQMSGNAASAQKSLTKFTSIAWQSGRKDTTFPFEHGPNWGCPRPIVPLTNDRSVIDTAIDGMLSYYSTGTFIPTGLVWGWHVLSPTEPFTEGIQPDDPNYSRTTKAVLLFTDGANVVSGMNNHNRSEFSGYNYTGLQVGGTYRLGSPNAATAVDNMDAKTAELCENVKVNGTAETDDDIRLYTITFGDMSSADETLMRNCASLDEKGNHLYFHAPSTGDLQGIFSQIGEDLSTLHLSM